MRLRSFWCMFEWLIMCLVVGIAAQAVPQATQLRGSVLDENGVPVAGAEILVMAPDGQRQATYTDEVGHFEFRLPRAGDYRVSVVKPGFFRLADQPIQLTEGVNEVSFRLSHEFEVHEEVEVTSSTNRVEPQETAHQQTLVAHEIRDIPVPSTHSLLNTLPALPGVVRDNSGQLHVAGARAGETQFQLDGFEINDPATGDLSLRVNVDTVRAIQMETGRYGAQYAHAGAGVLALDTSTGDDKWRFGTTNFIPGASLERGVHFGNWFPRFTLSGPLRKGRAWFSEAVSLQHSFELISGLPRGSDTITRWAGDNFLRVQVNLAPMHVLQGSFLSNRLSAVHLGLGPFTPLSTTTNLDSRRYFASLKDQIWVRNTLLELGVAVESGESEQRARGSQTYVLTPGGASGNYFQSPHRQARRWQFIGNVMMPSRHWHGSHDLQAGTSLEELAFTHSALRNSIEAWRADNTLSQRITFLGPDRFHLSNTQLGFYAQDTWRVSRLVVQFGWRTDWDRIIQSALFAPRFSVNFLPFQDERTKLAIGWGIYHQPVLLSLFGQVLDQQRIDVFFDATGRNPVLGPTVSRFALPAGGLRQPRFRTTSVGWVQRFGRSTFASVHLIHRDQRLGFAYEALPPDQSQALFLLQNHRRDRYRSAEISLRHSFHEKAELFFDYTRSRARSNRILNYSLGALLFAPQAPGPLAWDAPNRLLSWGWMPAPIWKLWLSYFFEYRTGFPFSVINQRQELVGPPNRLRFPDYVSLNVGLEKRFRLRGHEWAVRLAVMNITDHSNPEAVVNNVDAPNFLTLAGGQRRALTARIRLVGKK